MTRLHGDIGALQGTSPVFWIGHSRDTLRLGAVGIVCGCADFRVGRGTEILGSAVVNKTLRLLSQLEIFAEKKKR